MKGFNVEMFSKTNIFRSGMLAEKENSCKKSLNRVKINCQ